MEQKIERTMHKKEHYIENDCPMPRGTAMQNTIHDLCPVLFNFFVPFSQEEKEKEREQKEKAWETSGLPSTPGGGKGATAQQDHGGARCYLLCSLSPEHWRQEG